MYYDEDDMLMLSGIQHYRFCPRQWALIHIEQQWADNRLTVEGDILHKHVDDAAYRQKCGDYIALRSVNIASRELGLYGLSDVIELHPTEDEASSIAHPKYPGRWIPYPVEYKHGRPKKNEVDEVQLAAQAMCLEEQHGIHISWGAFFYHEIRHRVEVEITPYLRDIVRQCAGEMHSIFKSGRLPAIIHGKHCDRCSLKDLCMPETANQPAASTYLKRNLYEETA